MTTASQPRLTRRGVLAGISASGLLASTARAQQQAEIRLAFGSEPSTLDPQLMSDGGERLVNQNIFQTLIDRQPDGSYVPTLAEALPTLKDDLTWEMPIRTGIRFHNGEPFDAEVAAAAVKRIIDPEYRSRQIASVSSIAGAEAVNATTLRIRTKTPDPTLPLRLTMLAIVPREASRVPGFADKPVGTGPYRVAEWSKGARIVIEADPGWRGDRPTITRAVYRFIPEPATRLAGLLAGELDVINNLAPEDSRRVPQTAAIDGLFYNFMVFNALAGPTQDRRVRLALNYAIDRAALAEQLYGGFATPARGQFIGKDSFGFDPDLAPYPFDPGRAQALLRDARATGATIEIVGTAGRWMKDRETIEAVAGFWEAVGVRPVVRMFEFREFLNRIGDRNNRPQVFFSSAANNQLDADRLVTSYLGANTSFSSSNDAEINALIGPARSELDTGKRLAAYHTILRRAHEQAYFATLMNYKDIYGLSARVRWQPRADQKVLISDIRFA